MSDGKHDDVIKRIRREVDLVVGGEDFEVYLAHVGQNVCQLVGPVSVVVRGGLRTSNIDLGVTGNS